MRHCRFLHLFLFSLSISFLSLVSTVALNAQSSTLKNTKVLIKTNPFRLFAPIHPGVQLGLEIPLIKGWSIQTDAGFLLKQNIYSGLLRAGSEVKPNAKGWLGRIEVRNYSIFNKNFGKVKANGAYLAQEFQIMHSNYNRVDDFVEWNELVVNVTSDEYRVNKWTTGSIFKIGYQDIRKSGLVLDLFVGLGFHFRTVTHLDTDTDHSILSDPDKSIKGVFYRAHEAGTRVRPTLSLGLKIGFAL